MSGFEDVVLSAWGSGGVSISDKHGKVREDVLIFNKKVFGYILRRKGELENRLRGVQEKLERVDSTSLSLLERFLQKDYFEVLKQEELLWYQKLNEKWVNLGDRNTSFSYSDFGS